MSKHIHDVIIIGAGTTGAATGYHLSKAGVKDILCLEMGRVGQGRSEEGRVPNGIKANTGDELAYSPQNSGSAVFAGGDKGPRTIKMIVTLPPYLSLSRFAEHHGWGGVKTYLELAAWGRDLQISLANQILSDPGNQIKQCGSLMVGTAADIEQLRREYQILQKLNCPCEWWDKDRVIAMHGRAAEFIAGIWFENDARIDAPSYAEALLNKAIEMGTLCLRENCPPVARIETDSTQGYAEVTLADGSLILSKHVVIATGGMYINKDLAGLITPRYSYLVALPHGDSDCFIGMTSPDSANFFTYGFSHDWCVADNFVRLSGEDGFSALKSPRTEERCLRLARWAQTKYPYLENNVDFHKKYAVYSETPDYLPIIGTTDEMSRICYMVGCNAWGQASLSAAASMVPALLGYRQLDDREKSAADFMSIRRFTGKKVADSITRAKKQSRDR